MQPLVPARPNLPPRRPESAPCLGPLTRQAAGSAATGPCGERGGEGSRGTEVQRWSRAGDSLVDLVAPGSRRDGAGVGGGAVLGCGQPDCAHSAFHCPLSAGKGGWHWSGTVCPTPCPSRPSFLLTNRTPTCSDHLVSCTWPPSQPWPCPCSRLRWFRKGCLRPLGKARWGLRAAHGNAHSADSASSPADVLRMRAMSGTERHRGPCRRRAGTQGWASRRAEGPCPGDAVEGPE